jgi:hypothetical protein
VDVVLDRIDAWRYEQIAKSGIAATSPAVMLTAALFLAASILAGTALALVLLSVRRVRIVR